MTILCYCRIIIEIINYYKQINYLEFIENNNIGPVSYTHLDVYKRQILYCIHNKLYSIYQGVEVYSSQIGT